MIDYRLGDTRDIIAAIPDGSVSLVASSPPFIALRSYLPADHPDKDREIGSEPDPATFLDTLLGLTAEWGRVLAPWGSIAIELGDTYAGSGGAATDRPQDGNNARATKFDKVYNGSATSGIRNMNDKIQPGGDGWPRAKSLALVPQAYALSLAYGRNILTGNPSPAGQWLVRNMVVWHRPNPAVGALGDKYRPSTSYITVATRSPKRWFDLTAVRGTPDPAVRTVRVGSASASRGIAGGDSGNPDKERPTHNPAGAPPLDCWFDHDDHDTGTITTQPSRLAHYAMWPPKLAERLILSMCPLEVCGVCGEPRRRVEERDRSAVAANIVARNGRTKDGRGDRFDYDGYGGFTTTATTTTATTTLGWTDCGHDAYRPGVVLDPFAGTGTTLAVAELHGRDSIGIDIDARNRDLLPARIDECRKALFGVAPQLPGQMEMFA